MRIPRRLAWALLTPLFLSPAVPGTRAEAATPDPDVKLYVEECGACHVPYLPRFLPAESWRAIIAGLSDHFGDDASLDPETAKRIEAFLVRYASPRKPRADRWPPLRISELDWFKRAHRHEVSPRRLKQAGTWANCTYCHRSGEGGDEDD